MKLSKNKWKTATILLGVFCFVLFTFNFFIIDDYDLGKFKVEKERMDFFVKTMDYQPFSLCNLKLNECVRIDIIED